MVFTFFKGFWNACSLSAGHELHHRKGTLDKIIGSIPYVVNFQAYYWDEHCAGHHRNLATPHDPASSDKGAILYTAIIKSVWGNHVDTWKREEYRIEKRYGKLSWFATLTENKMIMYQFINVSVAMLTFMVFGYGGLIIQGTNILWGNFYFELLNYMEHYGLKRLQDKEGIYEPVGLMHAWSALASPILFRI